MTPFMIFEKSALFLGYFVYSTLAVVLLFVVFHFRRQIVSILADVLVAPFLIAFGIANRATDRIVRILKKIYHAMK